MSSSGSPLQGLPPSKKGSTGIHIAGTTHFSRTPSSSGCGSTKGGAHQDIRHSGGAACTYGKKAGKIPIRPPSPPLTRSRAVKGVVFSSGMSLPPINSASHLASSCLSLSSHMPPPVWIPDPSSPSALDLVMGSRPPLPPSKSHHLYVTCSLPQRSTFLSSYPLSSVQTRPLPSPSPSVNSTLRYSTRSTTK